MQTLEGKPKIDYPTMWEYRVIGRDEKKLNEVIAEIFGQNCELLEGKSSSGGKFVSLIVRAMVENQEQRDRFFALLKQNPEVNMVL